MPAVAFSNNDIAVVAWTFDRHLDGCLGFQVVRIDGSGKETVLPALARFAGQPDGPGRTTRKRRSRSSGGRICSPRAATPTATASFRWAARRAR